MTRSPVDTLHRVSVAQTAWTRVNIAEGIPGVTVDKYGSTLFVQSWRNPVVRARLFYPYVRNTHSVVGTADTLTLNLDHHSLALQSPDPMHQERGELLELCDAVRADGIDGIGAVDRVWLHPRSTDALRWNDDSRRARRRPRRTIGSGSATRSR